MLVASGVAVIQPNYRGSLGYGLDFAEALIGHVGEMDVEDCAALTRKALAEFGNVLDPARGAVYGGSHGGFLTAWLLGAPAHQSLYACGVLWNPVTDLPSMLGSTDIPEWIHAEGALIALDDPWHPQIIQAEGELIALDDPRHPRGLDPRRSCAQHAPLSRARSSPLEPSMIHHAGCP